MNVRVILMCVMSLVCVCAEGVGRLASDAGGGCRVSDKPSMEGNVVAQKLRECDFLLNGRFKRDAKVYLCLFSASWCPPCRKEMPRIAKTYAKLLRSDPDIELIHFSLDQDVGKALSWARENDVKFPVVKCNGGEQMGLRTSGIPHLFIVKADGTLVSQGHPAGMFDEERVCSLTWGRGKTVVDGYTWSYLVRNDEAMIVAETNGTYCCAVSPNPKGRVSIPGRLGAAKVTRIGRRALFGCHEVTSITIPSGVTSIGDRAFGECGKLMSVMIPSDVTSVGVGVFSDCIGITRIGVASDNQSFSSVGGVLYTKDMRELVMCPGGLTSISIPSSVNSIRPHAVGGCGKLRRICVAGSNSAYSSLDGVLFTKDRKCLLVCPCVQTSVTIPSDVKCIEDDAFANCRALTAVKIPASVTRIGLRAFVGCSELKSVTMCGERPESPPYIFSACKKLTAIHVPPNSQSWAELTSWQGIPLVFDAKSK